MAASISEEERILRDKLDYWVECIGESTFRKDYVRSVLVFGECGKRLKELIQVHGRATLMVFDIGNFSISWDSLYRIVFLITLWDELNQEDWLEGPPLLCDASLSHAERNVLTSCGFHLVNMDRSIFHKEEGVMMFYIPGNAYYVWNEILRQNWDEKSLRRIMILGPNMRKWCMALPYEMEETQYARTFTIGYEEPKLKPKNMDKNHKDDKSLEIWAVAYRSRYLPPKRQFDDDEEHRLYERYIDLNLCVLKWHLFKMKEPFPDVFGYGDQKAKDMKEEEKEFPPLFRRQIKEGLPYFVTDKLHLHTSLYNTFEELRSSRYYQSLASRIMTLPFSAQPMQMCVYGLQNVLGMKGLSNSSLEIPALALLLRDDVKVAGKLFIHEPRLSAVERKVLQNLGVSLNGEGFNADAPTIYFVAERYFGLFGCILRRSWNAEALNKTVILGIGFDCPGTPDIRYPTHLWKVLNRDGNCHRQFWLSDADALPLFPALHGMAWHFFNFTGSERIFRTIL